MENLNKLKNYCVFSTVLFISMGVLNLYWFFTNHPMNIAEYIFSYVVASNYLVSGTILVYKMPKIEK